MKELEPLSNFVFLKWEKKKESKSGIVLSDVSKTKPSKAKVVAVGPGEINRKGDFKKMSLKVGDMVLVDPFIPQMIKIEDEEYWIARESDIYAKIN